MLSNRNVLVAVIAAVLLAGCNKDAAPEPVPAADAPTPATVEPPEPVTSGSAPAGELPPADDAADAPEATPFDVATVPVSDIALGDWPYIAAPDGYELRNTRTLDLSQVPFWTGEMLQPVEGKVFEARVRETGEKSYSRFEVLKRFDEALTALGAQKITTSEVPRAVIDTDLPKNFGVEFNTGAGGYYGNQEVSTYVLRQTDRVVWFKVYSDGNNGSLLIAESGDVPAGAPAAG